MAFKIKKHSFTIIELAIIVTIIAFFAGIIIVYSGSVNKYSRDSKRKTDMDAIRKALLVQSNMGSKTFPVESDWCCVGATNAEDRCQNLETALAGYISKIPKDPSYSSDSMANCYMFKSRSDRFEMYSVLEGGGIISFDQNTNSLRDVKEKYSDCPNDTNNNEWISAPGFCVMKYEARSDGTYNCKDSVQNPIACPVSKPSDYPWVIDRDTAEAVCESIGAHLMNNAEWMAIAKDVEGVESNWINGSLKRGNIGATLETGYNIGNIDSGNAFNLAELELSNGEKIWHFSGNVSEWINYEEALPISAGIWYDYSAVDATQFGKIGYFNIGPDDQSDSLKGVGKVRNNSGRYFARGGNYTDTDAAGIYALELYADPYDNGKTGFRCAK